MIEAILQIFIDDDIASQILSNGIIEFIFMVLLVTFALTILIHFSLYNKLKKIRNYITTTNKMEMEPLKDFKDQFEHNEQYKSVKIETFVQEKFSSWRMYNLPVVNIIKLVQMTVSIFILVGVLGTFIGLTISLGSINASGDQMIDEIANVLSGIDVAFYTSITGMGLSLIMTVLIKLFNTEYLLTDLMLKVEENLEEAEKNGIEKLIQVSENINTSIDALQKTNEKSLGGIEKSFKGFQDYTDGLQKSAENLNKFNKGLANNLKDFDTLFKSMKKATVGFEVSTEKLNKNFDQLFTYFKAADTRNEEIKSTFNNSYKKITELSTKQVDTLKQFEEVVVDLKKFSSSILTEQQGVQGSVEKINHSNQDLVKKLDEQNNEFRRIFGNDLDNKMSTMNSYLSELSKDFDQLGYSLTQLPDALKLISQTQSEYKHLLSDRFAEIKQFNHDFNSHLKNHASESALFEKHLQNATNTYEQIGMKNTQLIKELNATLSDINRSFQDKEDQLDKSVGVLKDTLTHYVNNLEGTVADKLEKVVRSIGNSMELTNDGIRKDFNEIRSLTEEIHHNNTKLTQQMLRNLQQEIQKISRGFSSTQPESNVMNENGNTSPGLRSND